MSKSSENILNYNSDYSSRVEKIERTQNCIELRLAGLITWLRANYENDSGYENKKFELKEAFSRVKQMEMEENPWDKVKMLEQRIEKLENGGALKDFKKNLDTTHEKIKNCMSGLKEIIVCKEKELSSKVFEEINSFKQNAKSLSKKDSSGRKCFNETYDKKQQSDAKNNDGIERIIQDLREKLRKKSQITEKENSESFCKIKKKSFKLAKKKKTKARSSNNNRSKINV